MKGTPCCPLCHNEMSGNNVVDLTQELEDEIRNLPDKLQTTETLLKIEQRKYEKLISIKPLIERVTKLSVEVPQMKKALKITEDKLAAALNDVENFELQLLEPKMNLQVTNNMLGDMSLLDEAMRSVASMTREIDDLQKKLPDQQSSMTMEEAKMSRSTIAVELRAAREAIDDLQHKIETSTDKINKAREQVNQLNDRKIQLQEKRQCFDQFNKRSLEIVDEIVKINNEIRELDAKLGPATARLEAEIENKRKIKEKNRQELNALFNKADAIKKTNRDIER
jgi:DNA repair protein RAD50